MSGILIFMPIAALITRFRIAGVRTYIGVDSGLQSARMDVVHQRFHPIGKANWIDNQFAAGISSGSNALLNQHIAVPKIPHPGGDQRICLVANRLLVVVTEKMVPTGPSHRWRRGQICLQLASSLR